MSKGSMLKLFEVKKRAWSVLFGPSHCRDSFIANQDVFYSERSSNRPVQEPRPEGLVKLIWWTPTRSVRPSSRAEARRSTGNRLLVDKRVHRHAGAWAPKSCGQP
jgi:hypothetical protein